jgi:hypothetical protein
LKNPPEEVCQPGWIVSKENLLKVASRDAGEKDLHMAFFSPVV